MKVIFACVHNAGRSQMAAAFFNQYAQGASALSAGTAPADKVHDGVLQSMREVGIDLGAVKPQLLTAELARGADMLITMGCGEACPHVPGLKRDDWPLPDPAGRSREEVASIRDEIKRRVQDLLVSLGCLADRGAKMRLQVFEPPMCCSTGLCGPAVDPRLVEFSADLDWLKHQGVEVERYNLSQQPAAFVANESVRELLQKQGNDCLPVLLVNASVKSSGVYPNRTALADLLGLAGPAPRRSALKFSVQSEDETCCDSTDNKSCCG